MSIRKTLGAWCAILLCVAARPSGAESVRVLILTGQNNHAWQETTPVLRQLLEQSGRFTVDLSDRPETTTAESVSKFDVILSNWNTWGDDAKVKDWPEPARRALIDFVRSGKGFVSVHAGTSSFYDWNTYQELAITSWKLGETGHGRPHSFRVTPTAEDHPITRGMTPFATTDELWHRVPIQAGAHILATAFSTAESGGTGREEPVVMTRDFGKGRSVNILLGHDARAMSVASYGLLLTRSAEWAATGVVTLPARSLAWSQDANHLALKLNGDVLWQLNFGKDASKPHFHPLSLAGGPTLSWQAPSDHVWHHGLWFSWKYINGVNYWEEDPKTGRAQGATVWNPPVIATKPDGAAEIRFELWYEHEAGKKLLTERRALDVSAPGKDGGYRIDWTSEFEAQASEVKLDRTPILGEPNGAAAGGYAGLSMRFSELKSPVVYSDSEPVATDTDRTDLDANALDYSGEWDGRRAGLAVFQFPGNPVSPTPWYVITRKDKSFYYFSPALLFRAPRTLKAGEKLALRYRLEAHSGVWDSATLRAALDEVGGAKPSKP